MFSIFVDFSHFSHFPFSTWMLVLPMSILRNAIEIRTFWLKWGVNHLHTTSCFRYTDSSYFSHFSISSGFRGLHNKKCQEMCLILVKIRGELSPHDLPFAKCGFRSFKPYFIFFLQKLQIFGMNGELGNFNIVNHCRNVVILVKMRGESPPYDFPLSRYGTFVVLSHC